MSTRVLVVEDDPLISLDVERALKAMGHDVVGVTARGEEAIELARKLSPDLYIMDITLAGEMDGIQAAAQIVKESSSPVLFLTGTDDEDTLARATRDVKPYAYLIKPFDRHELKRTVEIVVARASDFDGGQEPIIVEELTGGGDAESNSDERFAALSKIQTLSELSSPLRHQLAQSSSIKEFSAGSFIFSDGELPTPFVPLSGRLALIESCSEGKELILNLLGPGDSFGLLAMEAEFYTRRSIRAQLDSRVLFLARASYSEVAKKDSKLAEELYQDLSLRLSKAYSLAVSLAHSRVETRIITVLLNLLPKFGKDSVTKGEVRLFLTRKELAELTGTTSETAIRVTKQLERDGYLDLTRPGIIKILNTERLEALLFEH